MKTKPSKRSKRREKSILNGTNGYVKKPKESPETLLERAATLLQQSQPEEALQYAVRALEYLEAATDGRNTLSAILSIGHIHVELGDIESAREYFSRAVVLDPSGEAGPEACLSLAQLSEDGGSESIKWFQEALTILRRELASLENQSSVDAQVLAAEKKIKMANALCSMTELYMTDLSWVNALPL